MKQIPLIVTALVIVGSLGACARVNAPKSDTAHTSGVSPMRLGNFSVSLTVKDLAVSRAFYEKLGFAMTGGDGTKWAVMMNGTCTIGLFQGMFERNMLTFNPGWDSSKATLPDFDDVRELQKAVKAKGLSPNPAADEATAGPAYFMLTDPDGNPILFDQHVASPKR